MYTSETSVASRSSIVIVDRVHKFVSPDKQKHNVIILDLIQILFA